MLNFFKGWKRKAGCVTLVMACAFAGLWIRSFGVVEFVFIANSGEICQHLVHSNGIIAIDFSPPRERQPQIIRWAAFGRPKYLTTIHKRFGFGVGPGSSFHFPYWSIVLPLTLVSAYLLLSKPRREKRNLSLPTDPDHA